jgi:DNA-binding transcriptional regulator YdaS (Cro superfamily)
MVRLNDLLYGLLRNRGQRPIDLARAIGADKGTVSRWNVDGVPPSRLEDIERVTGIPACDLRPDLARVFVKKARAQ